MRNALVLASLLASGCITHTPWQKTSTVGPWCAAEKRADAYTRFAEPFPIAYGCAREIAYATRNGTKVSYSSIAATIDELLAAWDVRASWPESGAKVYTSDGIIVLRKPPLRKPPFGLYLVAIDPVIVIGVHSPAQQPGMPRPDEYFPEKFFFPKGLQASVFMTTEILIDGQGSLVLLRSDRQGQEPETLSLSDLPVSIQLAKEDYIHITKVDLRLYITRTVQPKPEGDGLKPAP